MRSIAAPEAGAPRAECTPFVMQPRGKARLLA